MTTNALPTTVLPLLPRQASRLAMVGWVRTFLALLAVAILLRIVAMIFVPLVPEEAYYWNYFQHPNLSYYDHPPMGAWVIGAGTTIFGNNEFGVRFVGHLLSLLTSVMAYYYGRMWYSRTVGIVSAIAFQALPMFYGIGFIATMDSALVFFWMACLLSLSHVLLRGRSWCWYPAGLALGGALLSKYTGIFLFGGTGLALLLHRPWRRQFLSIHPYLAILLGAATFSPVVIWNHQNDWASFRFQFLNRFDAEPVSLKTISGFLFFQVVVLTPLFLIESARLVGRTVKSWRRLTDPRWLMAMCFSLPLVAVMAWKSLRYQIHLNWTLPAFLALLPAVTHLLLMRARLQRNDRERRWSVLQPVAITAIACAVINVGMMVFLLAVQPRTHWLTPFGPWPELAEIVDEHEDALQAETGREPLVIVNGKYRLASILAFYRNPLEGNNCQSTQSTTSQWRIGMGEGLGYPYWAPPGAWKGADCVIVLDRNKPQLFEAIRPMFDRLDVVDDPRLAHLKGGYSMAIGRGLRDLPTQPPPSGDPSGD